MQTISFIRSRYNFVSFIYILLSTIITSQKNTLKKEEDTNLNIALA